MSGRGEARRLRNKAKERQDQLDALAPKAGDIAPDFVLSDTSGENAVRLSDYHGRLPVALVFGSHT